MGKIEVNAELCKGCKLCIPVCPKKLIVMGDAYNSKGIKTVIQPDSSECTACKLCGIMCPEAAISVYRG